MQIKTIGILYTVLLVAFAIPSIAVTWANDTPSVLALEITIDLIIIGGVILAISGLRHRSWIVMIGLAVTGEAYLLLTDRRLTISNIILWCIVLAPALYFHSIIVVRSSKSCGNETNT